MSGDERAGYLNAVCDDEVFDIEWQTIVDVKTGIAYSMECPGGFDIPRMEVAALIDAGELP